MGNRAIVCFADAKWSNFSPAIYLHWNGGPESIYAFLDELDRRQVRADQIHESGEFVHIVGDYFDQDQAGHLSLGLFGQPDDVADLQAMGRDADNGVFLVCRAEGRKVRRFIAPGFWRNGQDRELTAEEVERERQAAYSHRYNTPQPEGEQSPNVSGGCGPVSRALTPCPPGSPSAEGAKPRRSPKSPPRWLTPPGRLCLKPPTAQVAGDCYDL